MKRNLVTAQVAMMFVPALASAVAIRFQIDARPVVDLPNCRSGLAGMFNALIVGKEVRGLPGRLGRAIRWCVIRWIC